MVVKKVVKKKEIKAKIKKKEPIKKEIVDKKTVEKTNNNNNNNNIVTENPPPKVNDNKKTPLGDFDNDKNLVKIENGKYALKNQKVDGINIVIHNEIPPAYPELALKMGYRKKTIVKVRFLVGKDGHVSNIKFYTNSTYGFEDEVRKVLKNWVFEPILYNNSPTPVYFYKVFNFVAK
jgi:TonB family protein